MRNYYLAAFVLCLLATGALNTQANQKRKIASVALEERIYNPTAPCRLSEVGRNQDGSIDDEFRSTVHRDFVEMIKQGYKLVSVVRLDHGSDAKSNNQTDICSYYFVKQK